MSDPSALAAALEAARTADNVFAAVARAAWHNDRDGSECPADAIPTPAALAAWFHYPAPESAREAIEESTRALAAVFGVERAAWATLYAPDLDGSPLARWFPDKAPPEGHPLAAERYRPELYASVPEGLRRIEVVHSDWLAMPEADRPPHPLAPQMLALWR